MGKSYMVYFPPKQVFYYSPENTFSVFDLKEEEQIIEDHLFDTDYIWN